MCCSYLDTSIPRLVVGSFLWLARWPEHVTRLPARSSKLLWQLSPWLETFLVVQCTQCINSFATVRYIKSTIETDTDNIHVVGSKASVNGQQTEHVVGDHRPSHELLLLAWVVVSSARISRCPECSHVRAGTCRPNANSRLGRPLLHSTTNHTITHTPI